MFKKLLLFLFISNNHCNLNYLILIHFKENLFLNIIQYIAPVIPNDINYNKKIPNYDKLINKFLIKYINKYDNFKISALKFLLI